MNEKINRINDEDKVISLSALCFYVLKKWKLMLVAAIIMAVAVGSYFSIKDYRAYEATAHLTAEQKLAMLGVPEDQKEILHMKLDSIKNHQELIKEYKYYYANSIKVRLDPNHVNQGTATYMISAEEAKEALKATAFCEEKLFSEDTYAELAAQLSEETDVALLKEVVRFERTFVVNEDNKETVQSDIEYKIVVRHFNEEDCAVMLKFVEEKMDGLPAMLVAENVNAEVEKISSNLEAIFDRSLATLSKDVHSGIQSAYESISSTKKNLKDSQKVYYDYLMGAFDSTSSDAADKTVMDFFAVEKALFGAIAGAAVVAVIYVAIYLLNGRVHNREEMQSWIDAPVIDLNAGTDLMVSYVRGIVAKNQAKSVYLTGTVTDLNTEVMKHLKEELAADNCEMIIGNSILTDSKAIQNAVNCGNVIMFEKANVSKEKEVREIIMKASSCGVKVLAIIL